MALFGKGAKKKPEAVIGYSDVEQGAKAQAEIEKKVCDCEECVKLSKVLENQQTIVANQQVILNGIEAVAQLIVKLAGEAQEEDEEPTEEEIQAAILAAKAQKKAVKAK